MKTALSLMIIIAIACGTVPMASAAEPINIGSRLELFVDEHLVDKLGGEAGLYLHKPKPREVVLVTNEPWEGSRSAYFTVFPDGDVFRMYYRGSGRGHEVTCYAESADGIHWTKPSLGLLEFEGSKDNNIVWDGVGRHNFTPFKDTNPDCPPEARYKALGERGHAVLIGFESYDALGWQVVNKAAPVLIPEGDIAVGRRHFFDSQNLAFWDQLRKRYVMFFREWDGRLRMIRTVTSDGFESWEYDQSERLAYTNADVYGGGIHLYTNAVLPYDRAPHIYLGFPTRYFPKTQQVEPYFMASRDGHQFYFWGETPVISRDAPEDRDGNRSNYMAWGLLQLPGDEREYSVYATEGYREQQGRLRRFTYRVDGFVSVRASGAGGELVTKPLTFAGSKLVINFATAEHGSVRVEIQDAAGRPLEGFSLADCTALRGDAIEEPVVWPGDADLESIAGKPVRLQFQLEDADLFSFRFAE